MKKPSRLTILLFSVCWLAACTAAPAVTPSAAENPTSTPISVPSPTLPATASPEPSLTPTVLPTNTATPSPTATPIPLTIFNPVDQAVFLAGDTITISGIDQTAPNSDLAITAAIGGWLLAEAETAVADDGTWEANLPLPEQLSGPATITVNGDTASKQASVAINVAASQDSSATFIQLEKPQKGVSAVPGYAIFFAGEINLPIRRTLEIGILYEDCSLFATRLVYELGNGRWQGMMVLPSDAVTGPACAIARTGNPEESETWQAALLPLNIVSPDDEAARQITLGNAGDLIFSGSEPVELFGTAVLAINNEVDILLNSDDGNYSLLAMDTVPVNSFGLWEFTLELEESFVGPALLTISTGSGDNYAELRVPLTFTR